MVHSLITDRTTDIAGLCHRHGVRRLELFGSATSEDFDRATSDLDFLVEFEPRESGQFDAYFDLKEGLESLLARPVDLVVTSAIRNRFFLEAVNQQRELIYAA